MFFFSLKKTFTILKCEFAPYGGMQFTGFFEISWCLNHSGCHLGFVVAVWDYFFFLWFLILLAEPVSSCKKLGKGLVWFCFAISGSD